MATNRKFNKTMKTRKRMVGGAQRECQNTQSTDDEVAEIGLWAKTPQKNLNVTRTETERRPRRVGGAAVDGVLGLASLISGRDQSTPTDWAQPYYLLRKSTNVLPTGLPLAAVELLKASYEVYYGINN